MFALMKSRSRLIMGMVRSKNRLVCTDHGLHCFAEFLPFQKLLQQIQSHSNISFNIEPDERLRAIIALLFMVAVDRFNSYEVTLGLWA